MSPFKDDGTQTISREHPSFKEKVEGILSPYMDISNYSHALIRPDAVYDTALIGERLFKRLEIRDNFELRTGVEIVKYHQASDKLSHVELSDG